MAIKDWEKISNFSYVQRWQNRKNAENVVVEKSSLDSLGWMVHSWKIGERKFKTKKAALNFATNYMRRH
jgi:hypothetical protein